MEIVFITGANRGLGLEFVRQYLAEGNAVIAACRDPEQATELNEFVSQSNQIDVVRLDVADEEQIREASREVSFRFDRIDTLIHNAGVFPPNQFDDVESSAILWAFRVNSLAPLLLSRELLPLLLKSKRPLVTTISSLLGSVQEGATESGRWAEYAYGPSKAALNRITRQLALDLRPKGIIVTAQNPGWVRTDMGGHEAPLSVEESIRNMRRIFRSLTLRDTGRIIESDGSDAPW